MGRGIYLDGPRHHGTDGWLQDLAAKARAHPHGWFAGQTAAALHQLDGFDPPTPIDRHVPRRSASTAHLKRRAALWPPTDRHGWPVASVEDTLLGLGDALTDRPGCAAASMALEPELLVELAVEASLRRSLTTLSRLHESLHATTNRRAGRALLASVLAVRPDEPPTGSYPRDALPPGDRSGGTARAASAGRPPR